MDNKYDVVVVGAGPAGGQCARELAKKNHNVLLLERAKIVGEPNFSSAATMKDMIKDFDLPKNVIQTEWNGLSITSRGKNAEFSADRTLGYVLDYKTLKQFLFNEAKKKGADVASGAVVKDIAKGNNRFTGVVLDGQKIEAKIIIDATGPATTLGIKSGLIKGRGQYAIGIEYLMQNVKLKNDKLLQFYLGDKFAPSGYMWIFPTKANQAKVGTARYFTRDISASRAKLDNFIKSDTQTKNAKIRDTHGGPLYFNYKLRNYVIRNLILIGDAAGQSNPLGGEGIRHAMTSGRFAAEICSDYLNAGKDNLSLLNGYNGFWKSYIKRKWLVSYALTKIVYTHSTDANADKLVSMFDQMSIDEILEVFFTYRFANLHRHVPFIIKKLLVQGN